MSMFISGNGQYWTDKNGYQYSALNYDDVLQMAGQPVDIEKSKAPWLIPSALPSRSHEEQKQNGAYSALWVDIDDNKLGFDGIVSAANEILDSGFVAYLTKSATPDNEKMRIIVPIFAPVKAKTWQLAQQVFIDKMASRGIECDKVSTRTAQLCYLPNKGEHYRHEINNNAAFNPTVWRADIKAILDHQVALKAELELERQQSRQKQLERAASGKQSPIEAYNQAYPVEQNLSYYGYLKKGSRYLSPNSGSKTPGVVIKGERWLSSHDSDSGIGRPYESGTSGDSFDLFTYYEHNNNKDKALKAAAEMFNIKEERQEVDIETLLKMIPDKPFSLEVFSMNGRSKELKQSLIDEVYVLGQLAIAGQLTVFHAASNIGKTLITLHLIIEAIKKGTIKGQDVFYINVDDNAGGFAHKNEIVEPYGIHMIGFTPAEDVKKGKPEFKPEDLLKYIDLMVADGQTKGKIIVLDTLKKFVNQMDKKESTRFGTKLRKFSANGGTVIGLSHVNKRKDDEGKSIHAGTTDIVEDFDCAYTIEMVHKGDYDTLIKFLNKKNRGNNAGQVNYRYLNSQPSYDLLLKSVEEVSQDKIQAQEDRKEVDKLLSKNQPVIDCITSIIKSGERRRTEIIKLAHEELKEERTSKERIKKVLDTHDGLNFEKGMRWKSKTADKNAQIYTLLNTTAVEFMKYDAVS